MKKLISTLCLSALLSGSVVALGNSKVAVIDLEAVLKKSTVFSNARTKIEKEHAAGQKEIEVLAADLKTLQEKIKSSKAVVSEAELDKMKAKFEEDRKTFSNKQMTFQRELVKDQQEAFASSIASVQKTVKEYAEKQGYQIVLMKNEAIYFNDDINITQQIESQVK